MDFKISMNNVDMTEIHFFFKLAQYCTTVGGRKFVKIYYNLKIDDIWKSYKVTIRKFQELTKQQQYYNNAVKRKGSY